MPRTTVLIAYRAGTRDILDTCLKSFFRHTRAEDAVVRVITNEAQPFDAQDILDQFGLSVTVFPIIETNGSHIHGLLLDFAIHAVDTELVLTLDSDCFPIADGWLPELEGMLSEAAVAGIRYPWVPIPADVEVRAIERRIRTHHCWNNVQVVCMLTRKAFLLDNNISFRAGDDTGFEVNRTAHSLGLPVVGWMPTRCPLPDKPDFDPEINRHVAVVYGDKVYHHGGATRTATMGQTMDKCALFSLSMQKVIEQRGAEFLLESGCSHKYRFDDEQKVADFKMRMMYDAMVGFLQTNQTLFSR